MPVKPVTKEDILNEGNQFWCSDDIEMEDETSHIQWKDALSAMDSWAALQTAERDARIKELEAKVNELTMADMTHEYNNAEGERFRPEHERQIKEPLEQRIKELEAGLRQALQLMERLLSHRRSRRIKLNNTHLESAIATATQLLNPTGVNEKE